MILALLSEPTACGSQWLVLASQIPKRLLVLWTRLGLQNTDLPFYVCAGYSVIVCGVLCNSLLQNSQRKNRKDGEYLKTVSTTLLCNYGIPQCSLQSFYSLAKFLKITVFCTLELHSIKNASRRFSRIDDSWTAD